MNELATINNYNDFKEALGTELRNQAEGFVRTGYLLKVARDTDILKESGYTTVAEFAQAEYGLSKDIVSRYIAINDRFSQDGYSEYLQDKYEGYGVAKLQEMLTLPEPVVDLLSPDISKREIQDIKKEIREEEQISDIEVILEGNAQDQENMTVIQKAIHKYFYEQREQFVELHDVIEGRMEVNYAIEKVMDVIAPSGMAIKTIRVQGIGKLMLSIKGKENAIEMLNVRSNQKEIIPWQQLIEDMVFIYDGKAGKKEWEVIYGEPFEVKEQEVEEKKPKVAPVQLKEEEKTETKSVEKTVEPEEEQDEKQPVEEECEQQVEGQTSIEEDFPELVPENKRIEPVKKPENETNKIEAGYKAAVKANLNKLKALWEGTEKDRLSSMISIAKDMIWRLEQLQKYENREED